MSAESFNSFKQESKIEVTKAEVNDQALFRDAQNKLDILDSFLEAGDITSDYNYFLEITGRGVNYKKATTESKKDLVKNLETILNSLKEGQMERLNTTYNTEARRMYYQELPDTEIKVLTGLLEFYN